MNVVIYVKLNNMQAKLRHRTNRPSARQNGAALLILLVIVIIAATGVLLNSLNRSSVALERNRITAEALAQAKEALIQYSMINGSRPGDMVGPDVLVSTELPDPDYDGTTESSVDDYCPGASDPLRRCLGRLPWRTLGMSLESPTENDAAGVMPWYGVSANLAALLLDPLNSETANSDASLPQPWMTVRDARGNIISSRVAAVIIMPGLSIGNQARLASPNLAGSDQYLDAVVVPNGCTAPCVPGTYRNSDFDNDFIMGEDSNRTADDTDNFNDKLIYITIDEVMAAAEKRVGNEIKSILNTYYASWGSYPFAAPFGVPSSADFIATTDTRNGLLPTWTSGVTPPLPTWESDPIATFSGGSGDADCYRQNSDSRWRCDLSNISGTPTISIPGVLNGVGLGLWKLHSVSDSSQIRVRISGSTTNRATTDAAISPAMNATVSASLNSAGAATIVFTAKVSSQITRIEFRDTLSARPTQAWFFGDNWNQMMYYAVSPGHVSGGGNSCQPSSAPQCLTVLTDGGNNRRAVVVMVGAKFTGQNRTSSSLINYLEGQNTDTSDFIYENQTRSTTFNDQVIVVAP